MRIVWGLVLLVCVGSVMGIDLTDKLVSHLNFDNASAVDSTGLYTVVNSGGIYTTSGALGGSGYSWFTDDLGDYLRYGKQNTAGKLLLTINVWMNVTGWDAGNYGMIVSNRGAGTGTVEMYPNNAGVFQTDVGTAGGACSGGSMTYRSGRWVMVTMVYNGSYGLQVYVNGTLAGTDTSSCSGLINAPGTNLTIGRGLNAAEDLLVKVDRLSVWNTSLSPADVAGLYAALGDPFPASTPVVVNLSITPWTPSTRINTVGNSTPFVFWVNGSEGVKNCSVYSNVSGGWLVGGIKQNMVRGMFAAFNFEAGYNDSYGFKTLSNRNVSVATGKLNRSLSLNQRGVVDSTTAFSQLNKSKNFSFSVWFRQDEAANMVVWNNGLQSSNRVGLYVSSSRSARFGYYNGTTYIAKASGALNLGQWHHVVGSVRDSTGTKGGNVSLWVDGVGITTTGSPSFGSNTRFSIGATYPGSTYFNGSIDELYFFDRVLSAADVALLYTNFSAVFGVPRAQNVSVRLGVGSSADGTHTWGVKCYNPAGEAYWSGNTTYVQDTSAPVAVFGVSDCLTKWHFLGEARARACYLNVSITDNLALYAYEYVLKNASGKVFNYTNVTLGGTSRSVYRLMRLENLSGGAYTLNFTVWDSHTASEIGEWDVVESANVLDFGGLSVRAVGAVSADAVKQVDRYAFEFGYRDVKEEREYVVESEGKLDYVEDSPFPGHFVDWGGKRWIDFDGEGAVVVQKLADNRYSVRVSTVNADAKPDSGLVEEVGFSSVGGLNSRSYSDSFVRVEQPSASWVFPVTPYGLINGTNGSRVSVGVTGQYLNKTVYRLYNGSGAYLTNYSVVYAVNGSHNYSLGLGGLVKPDYYVKPVYFDVGGNNGSLVWKRLTRPMISLCSGGNVSLNFVVQHEDYLVSLENWSVDFEVEGSWVEGVSTGSFALNASSAYNYSLCLSPFGVSPEVSAYVKYTTSPGYTHRYYLVHENITNVTRYVTLYNFNDTDLDTLRLTLRDRDTYAYYPNLFVKWQRYYVPEAVWRTVQMDESGDFGLTVFHIYEQTTDYRFLVFDELGRLVKTSDSVKFVCDTTDTCDVESLVSPYSLGSVSTNIDYAVTYNNNTNIITAVWTDLGGNVVSVRWSVMRETMRGAVSVCTDTGVGAGGTFTCNVTGVDGSVAVRLWRTASPEEPFYTEIIELVSLELSDMIGERNGALVLGAMLITAAGFGVASPFIGIVVTVFVLFIGMGLGLLSALSYALVITAAVMGIVVGLLVRK